MHPVFQFLVATCLFMLLHVSVMALCARAFGITIRRIAYGVGPTLFSIGKAQLRLLPFAGSVVLKDTREEDIYGDRGNDIYNERPLWQQLTVLLSGVAMPLILALGLLGAQGWHNFTGAFAQIVSGALGHAAITAPPLRSHVNDVAGVLAARGPAIDARLKSFEAQTGHQIYVLTVPSTGAGTSIDAYALAVFEQWQPGRKDQDDGALLLIATGPRCRLSPPAPIYG